ncbi:MAG: NINE protein [Alphaproteobacteria bacterium]|nr:NINE protein [Alphaproteobacteria bacterium]
MVQKKQKSAIAYALLALFLGGFGVHRYYAGKPGSATAILLINLTGIGLYIAAWGAASSYNFSVAETLGLLSSIATLTAWIWGGLIDMIIGWCNVKTPQKLFNK